MNQFEESDDNIRQNYEDGFLKSFNQSCEDDHGSQILLQVVRDPNLNSEEDQQDPDEFQDQYDNEDYFDQDKNPDQVQQVHQSPLIEIQVTQSCNAEQYLAKDVLLIIIKQFSSPIQQLLSFNNPELQVEHLNILKSYSDENSNTMELDKLIEGLNQIYENEQTYEYLGILYFFIDYLGVGFITRSKFNKVCQNINDCRLGEKEAIVTILISQLVFKKLSPLDQDVKNSDLEVQINYKKEFFKMHQKGLNVFKIQQHSIRMVQQSYDCLYVSFVLIRKEVWKQIYAIQGAQTNQKQDINKFDGQESNVNSKLTLLHQNSQKTFKQLEVPKTLLFDSTPEQQNEQIIKLYSLVQTTLNELDIYIDMNDLTIAIQEVFREQEIFLKELSAYFKETYPQFKQQFAKQRRLQSTAPPTHEKDQPLGLRTSFSLNEILRQDEDQTYEFKNYQWPFQNQQTETIIQSVICSFMNTKGGYLFFGINDDSKQVTGMQFTSKERDLFKQLIQRLMAQIYPYKDMANSPLLQVSFIPIQNQRQKNVAGNFVVRVTVQQGENDKFYTYQNHDKKIIGTLRLDGQKETYNYPQVADMIYKFCKNPRAKVEPLKVNEPDPISDILLPNPQTQSIIPSLTPNQQKNIPNPNQRPEARNDQGFQPQTKEKDQRTFKVLLSKDETHNRIKTMAKAVLGGFISKAQDFEVCLFSDREFDIVFKEKHRADKLCSQIHRQADYLKSLVIITSVRFNNNLIFENSSNQKQKFQPQQTRMIMFGFLKVEKKQRTNLIKCIDQLLNKKKIKPAFSVRPFKYSVLVGFSDRRQFEIFILEVQQQQSIFKQFGVQQCLLGALVTEKVSFKNLDEVIQQSLQENFQLIVHNKQDNSGYIECKNETVAAEVYDYLKNLNCNVDWQITDKMNLK